MAGRTHIGASGRLDQVDGLRAVAIAWVVLYHYAVFWTPAGKGDPLLPYGDVLSGLPLANVGGLGVSLFFCVSGFVISYSLSRAEGPVHFAALRMIRLWPTLLFCATVTFALTSLLGPASLQRTFFDYLVSLTFVPPQHVGALTGHAGGQWLDGAYWSLWTEVRFYIVAAILFFAAPRRFLRVWTVFAVICAAIHLVALRNGGAMDALSRLLFAEYQPFFTAGIALATLRRDRSRAALALLVFAIVQSFGYAVLSGEMTGDLALGLVIVFALAVPVMLARRAVPLLSLGPVVLAGQASYAYYLLHQNAGIALTAALAPGGTDGQIAVMLAVQVALLALALVATRRLEEPLRRALRWRIAPRIPRQRLEAAE